MISVLAQERLLGAALGGIFMGVIVLEQRKGIYALISENQPQKKAGYELMSTIMQLNYCHRKEICTTGIQTGAQAGLIPPLYAKKPPSDFAHAWNKAVDRTLGPVIVALSSRGW
ncbi:hypothetical protein AAC387_Pa01g4393 [Persea americana]